MKVEDFLKLDYVKYFTDQNCRLIREANLVEEFHPNPKHSEEWTSFDYSYIATLENNHGKVLARATSKVSASKALGLLTIKVKGKYEENTLCKTPFEKFRKRVDEITDLHFNNNDKAHHLSNNATFKGWDVILRTDDIAEVKIHNAGNTVLTFNLFDKYSKITVNPTNLSMTYDLAKKEAFPLLLDAIEEYFDYSVEDRKAEFERKK